MMESGKTRIFGLKFSDKSMTESVLLINKWAKLGKGEVVYCCTLNEILMSEENVQVKMMLEKADILTADGMPLVWVLSLKTKKKVERVYGPDLMRMMFEEKKFGHIFIGDEINKKFFEKYGKYIVMPVREKFTDADYKSLFKKIEGSKGGIVWLGLGSKKQIETAYELKKRGVKKVLITVGAAFDFLSGNKKQAPIWIRNIGGEWLFRLINEPRRLSKRYQKILIFLVKSFKKKLFDKVNGV